MLLQNEDSLFRSEVTMKLIYANGACSLSVHILLEELDIPHEALRVSLEDKTVLDSYNPRSYVPVLVRDDGTVMTEAISILQYLSTVKGGAFMPEATLDKTKCIEWLVFISSELHKGLGPLFHPDGVKPEFEKEVRAKYDDRLQIIEDELSEGHFLMGHEYTIADMYCLAILRIAEHVKVKFDAFPLIQKYKKNLELRNTIRRVIEKEERAELETRPRSYSQRMTEFRNHERNH